MSFSEQSFSQRFQVMGDAAEAVYEAVAPLGSTTRFGYRRPKGVKFGTFPEALRHAPDFTTASYFVEVMGLGRDGILKSMKLSKYEALKIWHAHGKKIGLLGVALFIWNSSKKQYIVLSWKDIVEEVKYAKRADGIQKFKNDGNEYYPLRWERLVERATFVGNYDE